MSAQHLLREETISIHSLHDSGWAYHTQQQEKVHNPNTDREPNSPYYYNSFRDGQLTQSGPKKSNLGLTQEL